MDYTPRIVIRALESLSEEENSQKREELLQAGLIEMIKWFTLAARIIVQNKIKLPKQTMDFMNRHKDAIQQLADANVDVNTKRRLILTPGGSGFLGGVMIRSLLRWNGHKTIRKFFPDTDTDNASSNETKSPVREVVRRETSPLKLIIRKKSNKTHDRKHSSPQREIDDRFVTKRSKQTVNNTMLSSTDTNSTPLTEISHISDVLDQISPVRSPQLSPLLSRSHISVNPNSILNTSTPQLRYQGIPTHQENGFVVTNNDTENIGNFTPRRLLIPLPSHSIKSPPSHSHSHNYSYDTPYWPRFASGSPADMLARFTPLNR